MIKSLTRFGWGITATRSAVAMVRSPTPISRPQNDWFTSKARISLLKNSFGSFVAIPAASAGATPDKPAYFVRTSLLTTQRAGVPAAKASTSLTML